MNMILFWTLEMSKENRKIMLQTKSNKIMKCVLLICEHSTQLTGQIESYIQREDP